MSDLSDETTNRCGICGEPMAPNEQMFKYHGYSGPCPKPPLRAENVERSAEWWMKMADLEGDHAVGAAGGALPDERVREMIATAERAEVPGWVQLQPVTFIALAREVLALRGTMGREQAIAEGLRMMVNEWQALAEERTRQRDEAVAGFGDAVNLVDKVERFNHEQAMKADPEWMGEYMREFCQSEELEALRARLAALRGEG